MNVVELKKDLRKEMLKKRASINKSFKLQYDSWICDKIFELVLQKNYKNIHAYLPMGDEININPLLQKLLANNLTVISPKTLPNRKLENRVLTSLSDIEKGVYGTTHPSNPTEYLGDIDLIIIPGLSFDTNNYRLGYGGGYYDNFLNLYPNALKLGIFYPFQKIENVPKENHDVKLDEILVNYNPF